MGIVHVCVFAGIIFMSISTYEISVSEVSVSHCFKTLLIYYLTESHNTFHLRRRTLGTVSCGKDYSSLIVKVRIQNDQVV